MVRGDYLLHGVKISSREKVSLVLLPLVEIVATNGFETLNDLDLASGSVEHPKPGLAPVKYSV